MQKQISEKKSQREKPERKTRQRVGRPRLDVPSDSFMQQRSKILRKATQLLNEGTYQNLSLARIAGALELSKASMYYYFKSKHHLLYALYEEFLDEHYERMSDSLNIEDSRARLLAAFQCQVQGIVKNLPVLRLRFTHFPFIEDAIVERCMRKEMQHTARLATVVESAIEDGHLPNVDSFLLMELIFGMPLLVYRSHTVSEFSPEYIESQVALLFDLA